MTTVGRPPKLDVDAVSELYRLADAGLNPMELGVRFKISLPTVYAYLKKKPRAPEKGNGGMATEVACTERGKDTPPEAEGRGKQVEAE